MQGPRRDSDSADILTYVGEWHKSEFPGYQPGNVFLEKVEEGYAPLSPHPTPFVKGLAFPTKTDDQSYDNWAISI